MVFITRKESFCAAHRLFRAEWTDEQNEAVFGKCANPNWHGHNYDLFVTVKGTPDPLTGFVINLKTLGAIVKVHVLEKIDHRNINLDVDFMKNKMASAEMLAVTIWEELEKPLHQKGCTLHSVKLQETANNYVEYFGPH